MKLYIKQKVFSWGDKFDIMNEAGEPVYSCNGEVLSLGKKLHLTDLAGNELAYIHQKLLSLLPKFYISRNGTDIATVKREFTLLKPSYKIEGFGWQVKGDFLEHSYTILDGDRTLATVEKKWITWGDTYEITIDDSVDVIDALSVVLVVDAVLAIETAAAS